MCELAANASYQSFPCLEIAQYMHMHNDSLANAHDVLQGGRARMSMSMSAASGWRLNSALRVFSSACPARLQRFSSGMASASITSTTCQNELPLGPEGHCESRHVF